MPRLTPAVVLAVVLTGALGTARSPETIYKIGVPLSTFREIPPALQAFAGIPFQDLFKDRTGLNGEVVLDPDAMSMARDIDQGKLHLGVFHGHEYAWAREKYPDLRALLCSVERPREVRALLLVRYDCKADGLAGLKDGKLALATRLKDHAALFLEKRRADDLKAPFAATAKTDTVHDAIHKVIDGEADLTIADSAAWNYFQKLYPGPSKNVKVLAESDPFPPMILVYKKGTLGEDVLKRLRDGFLSAHEVPKAVRMMALIRVEKFDTLPDGFEDSLRACLKAYPPPAAGK